MAGKYEKNRKRLEFKREIGEEMGYWRCKECGSKIVAYYGGTVDLGKNGYMIESTERDKSIDLYVCENGCDTTHTLEHIADWIEEDKKMKQQLMVTLFEKKRRYKSCFRMQVL